MKKLVLCYTLLFFLLAGCEETVQTTQPRLQTMTVSVYASAMVQPQDLYNAYAETGGLIQQVTIEEGSLVKKGQILAQIDGRTLAYDIEAAQLNEALAREKRDNASNVLAQIQSEIRSIRARLEVDSLHYFRQKRLWEQHIGSKMQLDSKKLQYETTREQLARTQQRYRQTKIELDNAVLQSQNTRKKAQASRTDFNIYANMDGKVYVLNKETGESISPQEVFAQIGAADAFVIEMQIDEVDITEVQVGQKVVLLLDAYPDMPFDATISKIFPTKNSRTQTFKVEATFVQPPTRLYAGLSGEANIIVSQKKNVLTIPLDYLTPNNKVIVKKVGEQAVQLGVRNMQSVEVLSGIDTTTVLVKPQQL